MFLGNNMVRILDEGSNNNKEPVIVVKVLIYLT